MAVMLWRFHRRSRALELAWLLERIRQMAVTQAEFAAALDSLAKDVEAGLATIKDVAQPVDLSAELATVQQLQTDFNALVAELAPPAAPEPTPAPTPEEPPVQ